MIKIFEMFSGYGGASFALQKAKIPFECVGYSEIDKHAIKCYNQNFSNIKNYGDCTKIDPSELPDFDLLTGGFPCQSFSIAGNRRGFNDTRGTLFREIIRIAEVKKPKYMLLENVRGLTNHDEGRTFDVIKKELLRIGYSICYKVLNTKNYGIPQNRERIFILCKLGKLEFGEFQFPKEQRLNTQIKDILEKYVDKKYYLSENKKSKLFKRIRYGDSIINIKNNIICVQKHRKEERVYKNYFPTLTCLDTCNIYIQQQNEIRNLTPKECFRLMGFLNDEINLNNITDSHCYKLAGKGWEINLVSKIFKELYKNDKNN